MEEMGLQLEFVLFVAVVVAVLEGESAVVEDSRQVIESVLVELDERFGSGVLVLAIAFYPTSSRKLDSS